LILWLDPMARLKKTQKLLVAIDFGTSGIKATGSIYDAKEHRHTIFLSPEIIEINESIAKTVEYADPGGIDRLWVRVEAKYFAIGRMARELMATTLVAQAKSRFICEKTAAVVWAIAKHFDLPPNIHLDLICLLPPGELREREILQDLVKKVLGDFEAPDGCYSVTVDRVQYLPEGIGIYERFKSWYGASVRDVEIGILMMGHRNTSFFTAHNNKLGTLRSSEIGFSRIVQSLGLPITDRLTEGTAKWLTEHDDRILAQILTSRGVVSQQDNLSSLKQTIDNARQIQVMAILQWLSEIVSTSQLGIVLIAGGAADSFKTELIKYFDEVLPDLPYSNTKEAGIFFHGGKHEVSKVPKETQNRFMDVLGVWQYLAK
jgi:hypothetical protein